MVQVGAQVMLLKNLELGVAGDSSMMLVNGSRGVVTSAMPKLVRAPLPLEVA